MTSALFNAVCSIAPTRRRRFFWAAWWTAPPNAKPFRKPDAADGGARTRAEAHAAAERAAGRPLVELESGWARAWSNVLSGKDPWPSERTTEEVAIRPKPSVVNNPSIWQTLGLASSAGEPEIKAAYRKRALELHPDRGGTHEGFLALQRAYESALKRSTRPRKRTSR